MFEKVLIGSMLTSQLNLANSGVEGQTRKESRTTSYIRLAALRPLTTGDASAARIIRGVWFARDNIRRGSQEELVELIYMRTGLGAWDISGYRNAPVSDLHRQPISLKSTHLIELLGIIGATHANMSYCIIQYEVGEEGMCVLRIEEFKCSRDKASVTNLITFSITIPDAVKLTTRTLAPNARGGRLERNFDLTTPDEPCGRVIRLHAASRQPKYPNFQSIPNPPPDNTDF